VFVGGAWGWVPCPPPVVAVAYVRPVYAPALVAWVGGPHFVAGFGFAAGGFAAGVNVGWFPLGPREVFVPSYPVSRTYVTNVNVSNTTVNQTVINNYYNTTVVNKNVTVNNVHYMNQGVAGAVTATSPQAFTSAKPVGRNMVAVNQQEVASAPAAVRAPAVVPPKQAVLGSGAPSSFHPPAAIQNRAVVAKTAPPPPPPSFAARQAAIEKNQGQPLSSAQLRQLPPMQTKGTAAAAVHMAPPATPGKAQVNTTQGMNRGNNEPGPLNAGAAHPAANNAGQPNGAASGNKPATTYADRPPASRPTGANVNQQLEQKHQQQIQQLQQKQDQEYQKLQQKQNQEQQQVQNDPSKQQQVQQKQQQQLDQMEQKHGQQQQNLKQKQEAEHTKAYKEPAKPKSEEKSHK
jgi:hypothetical protein